MLTSAAAIFAARRGRVNRSDGQGCYSSRVIDLDHNATTPVRAEVRAAMIELLAREDLGNPSSVHRGGQRARALVEQARRDLAATLGADAREIVFTSGGTEADNLGVLGAARALRAAGRPSGILLGPLEHPAVLGAAGLAAAEGHAVVELPVDDRGRIDPDDVAACLRARDDLGVLAVMAVHHELGNAYDVAAMAAAGRAIRAELVVHCDAVAAFGKHPLAVGSLGADLVAITAHKLGGPIGIGALWVRHGCALSPLLGGGAQERGLRPGTASPVAAVALALAARLATDELPAWRAHVPPLRAALGEGLRALGGEILGAPDPDGNTILVAMPACDGHLLVIALDQLGVRCSTGAACSAGTIEPSRVVRRMGRPELARQVVRFSLGRTNTAADVAAVLDCLPPILARVRAAGPMGVAS